MIKFLDIQKINNQYSNELKVLAQKIIDSGWYLLGENVFHFEKKLSDFVGAKYVITCANGLDSLKLILRGYIELGEMNEGDEIIVPSNTYIASILAIIECKLKPVLVEPDIQSYNLNISKIQKHITPRTRGIMLVHLYGQTCFDDSLINIKNKYGLKIIEDNAQAIGAKYKGKRTGNLGDAAGFSFYPGKNLGALGDSGAVSTNDKKLSDVIRTIANYGSSKKYHNELLGINSRMDEIQAGFLSIKIESIDAENNKRRSIANRYLKEVKNEKLVLPEIISKNCPESHVWHLFVIRTIERDRLKKFLLDKKIETLIHYPIPPHKQACLVNKFHMKFDLTEKIHREVLSIPISPVLDESEVDEIIYQLNRY